MSVIGYLQAQANLTIEKSPRYPQLGSWIYPRVFGENKHFFFAVNWIPV